LPLRPPPPHRNERLHHHQSSHSLDFSTFIRETLLCPSDPFGAHRALIVGGCLQAKLRSVLQRCITLSGQLPKYGLFASCIQSARIAEKDVSLRPLPSADNTGSSEGRCMVLNCSSSSSSSSPTCARQLTSSRKLKNRMKLHAIAASQ